MKIEIFAEKVVYPFKYLGLTSNFWTVHIQTLQDTWIAMFILFGLVLIGRMFLKKGLNPVALIFEQAVSMFDNLCKESFGSRFKYKYFAFVSTIFFFTLFCCLVGLLPYVEEPTKDLNTAFALGVMSFCYVQYQKIRVHGVLNYLKEYTQPFCVLLPLNVIGELAKIASMSFRLFGNILGGSIIFLIAVNALSMLKEYFMLFALITLVLYWIVQKVINLEQHKIVDMLFKSLLVAVFFLAGTQMFFGIFEGFVQAFVLTMLTITYLAVGIQDEEAEV
jgi:F-type H+-transporting ATPase subunit a